MKKLSIARLKEISAADNGFLGREGKAMADELINLREALKGDQVPVAVLYSTGDVLTRQDCVSDEVFDISCKVETPLFTAPQKPVVVASHKDCPSCDRHYVDGMKAGWNFHEEGDKQGFIDSVERVQKDMRESSPKYQVPVGWEVCSPEWCNKHNACNEAPRIWFESEDGTGPHYHPSEYTAPQMAFEKEFMPKNLDRALTIMGVSLPESQEEFNVHSERWMQRLINRIIRFSDELNSVPQKPVVLLNSSTVMSRNYVVKQIEAAGGKVAE